METQQIRELVGSRIFSVIFKKKDGTLRKMTCRFGVTKHLKGGELTYSPEARNYLVVFDMEANGYRTINLNTLHQIVFDGITYDV